MDGIKSTLDNFGTPMVGINRPTYVNAMVLVANTAATQAIPDDAKYVLFSGTADFYVRYSSTLATVPAASNASGTNCELNPQLRTLFAGDDTILSLISPYASVVTMSYYL